MTSLSISFLFQKILNFLNAGKFTIEVESLDLNSGNINYDLIYHFYEQRTPFLLQKGIKDWPLAKYTIDDFIKNFGNIKCTVLTPEKNFIYCYDKSAVSIEEYFSKSNFLNCFVRIDREQSQESPIFDIIDKQDLILKKKEILNYLFFHAKSEIGALPHIHSFNAFNVLKYGRKRWIMFEADPTKCLIGSELAEKFYKKYGHGSFSKVWFENEKDNLMKKVSKVYEFIQEEGDIVYIPKGYCHAVLNIEDTMGFVIGIT